MVFPKKYLLNPNLLFFFKNTEAARRSRDRKNNLLESLEVQVQELSYDKNSLKIELAVLETEKKTWVAREAELMTRVKELEMKLAESHRIMVSQAALARQ